MNDVFQRKDPGILLQNLFSFADSVRDTLRLDQNL